MQLQTVNICTIETGINFFFFLAGGYLALVCLAASILQMVVYIFAPLNYVLSLLRCTYDKFCVIGHFMCTFGPIVIFMVALPLFYGSTWRQSQNCGVEGCGRGGEERGGGGGGGGGRGIKEERGSVIMMCSSARSMATSVCVYGCV